MNLSESARFRAETVAPTRDLAESVVASLDRARLCYVEGLVILKSGFKAEAVIKRGCRLGRGGLGGACSSPLKFCQNFKPLLAFPLGHTVFFAGYAGHLPACIGRLFGRHELHHVAWLQHLRKVVEQLVVGLHVFGAPHRRPAQ